MDIEQQPKLMQDQEEEQPYSLEDIPTTISTNDHSVHLDKTILQITDQGFTLLQELPQEEWITIFTTFANTTSVGTDKTSLLIFVGDNQIQEEQQRPEIFTIIEQKKPANLTLNGHSFTVTLDFANLGKNVVKEVNDLLVKYMGEADQANSKYDQDEQFAEMISADDIDQNGNIINRAEGSDEQYSDEDGEEQK